RQRAEQALELRGSARLTNGHAENRAVRVELALRTDAERVGRDQREGLAAVTQAVPRGELRDRRGLADAGRADEREHAAVVERILFHDVEPPREPVHHLAPRAGVTGILDLRDERLRELR